MDIDRVLKNPRLIRAILGVSAREFESLLVTFSQVWREEAESKKRERKVGGGRIGRIKPVRNKLFFILWYVKVYPTFDVAAYVFCSSKTKTHMWVHNILPLLEKTLKRRIVFPKRRIATPEEFFAAFPGVSEVMLDGVERPTIRSKKNKEYPAGGIVRAGRRNAGTDFLGHASRRVSMSQRVPNLIT